MTTFSILQDMYFWYAKDIVGNELIAGIFVLVIIFIALTSINIPTRSVFAFLIPVAIGLIRMAYLGWFGWLIIGFAGIMFGYFVYKLFER